MVKKAKAAHFLQLDRNLVKQAFAALEALIKRNAKGDDLLQDQHEFLHMVLELNFIPEFFTLRPLQLPIPHPIYSRQFNSHVCLIVKDPQREWKEKVDASDLKQTPLSKIISIDKLGRKFKQFRDRRGLLRDYDLFLADVRVLRMLPDRTGKDFYRAKKTPVLLQLDEDMEMNLRRAMNSTFIVLGHGPVYNVKVARVSQTATECFDNLLSVLDALPTVIPGLQPHHIRRIDLKGANTLSLPVHNFLTPEEVSSLE